MAGVSRTLTTFAIGQPTVTADDAFASFFENEQSLESNRILLLPPVGTCTSYSALYHVDLGEFVSVTAALTNPGKARTLDAGAALTISGQGGLRAIPRSHGPGVYWTRLGLEDPSVRRNLPLFLNDRQYRISAPGGIDVPALSRMLLGVPEFEWTNRDSLATIQRARGATFEWRGIPRDALVLILVASFDQRSTAGEICYCTARADAGQMKVPAEMFAQFPVTGHMGGPPRSGATLIALRMQAGIPPPVQGLDLFRLVSVLAQALRVDFE
jgi:hypothetical protein